MMKGLFGRNSIKMMKTCLGKDSLLEGSLAFNLKDKKDLRKWFFNGNYNKQ
jgi:hypothetical protein